eukprot:UN19211
MNIVVHFFRKTVLGIMKQLEKIARLLSIEFFSGMRQNIGTKSALLLLSLKKLEI